MNVEVYAPSEYAGDLMGDLNGRRGRIAGMDTRGTMTVIRAQVPMSEMLTYEQQLTSSTGGRGSLPDGVLALRGSAHAPAVEDHRRGQGRAGREGGGGGVGRLPPTAYRLPPAAYRRAEASVRRGPAEVPLGRAVLVYSHVRDRD